MRVSLVAPVDPLVERPGGTRTYVMSLLDSLQKAGIDYTLVGIDLDDSDGSPEFDFVSAVTAPKVSSVKFLRGLMKVAKRTRFPDDTIIHAQRPDYLFPFLFRRHENRKVCTLHGQVSRSVGERKGSFYGRAYGLVESYSIKRTDHVIAVDDSTLDLFVGKYPHLSKKSSLIPVGIDVDGWGTRDMITSREALGYPMESRIGLYVGRLEREKRVDLMIESVKHVREHVEGFRFVVIGDGTLKNELEEEADRKTPGSVSFMGPQPRSVVRDMMTAADVFCLASDFESGPLVVLESLASGTPVVATDVGRVREFIPDRSVGRIVTQNPKTMAEAMVEVLKEDLDRMAESCRQKARQFSFDITFQKTLEVYENLSQKRE